MVLAMVYQTHLAELSPSLLQRRSSDKMVDVLERMLSSFDSEGSRSSSEEEVGLDNISIIASSSSYGSESTQVEDEVVGRNSDNFSGDLEDPIDVQEVEVVSENSEDSDEGEEVDGLDDEPILVEEDKGAVPVDSAATVILLQHIIRTEDGAAQHEELENESPGAVECQKKTHSFRNFRRHKNEPSTSIQGEKRRLSTRRSLVSALSMKTSKGRHRALSMKTSKGKRRAQSSASIHVDSREDTKENTDLAFATCKYPPKVKSYLGSQQFLASAIAMKISREQEDEESNSSNDNDSTDGTDAFTEDPDFVASINSSRCQTNGEWSQLANPALSLAPSDLSEGDTVDYPESIKGNKSARSRRSLQSFNIFERKRSGVATSVKSKRDGEDEDTTKTEKTNRSWLRRRKRKKTPKHENDFKSKRSFSLFRKPSWARRNQIASLDNPQEPPIPKQPSFWETFFEGCDNICCVPLYQHSDAEENASFRSDQSEAPSEIFVHLDSSQSKSLFTI